LKKNGHRESPDVDDLLSGQPDVDDLADNEEVAGGTASGHSVMMSRRGATTRRLRSHSSSAWVIPGLERPPPGPTAGSMSGSPERWSVR
jgi:hypothetical protein